MRTISRLASIALLAGGLVGSWPAVAQCAESSATVVIRTSAGDESTRCVELPDGEVNGLQLLRLSKVPIVTKDFGGSLGSAVCQINGEGNRISDCPGSDGHWHYWHLVDGQWLESQLGAGAYKVKPGAVDGWTWTSDSSVPPKAKPSGPCTPLAQQSASARSAGSTPFNRYAVFLALAIGLITVRYRLRRRGAD